jgi:hypothetical protein
VRRQNPRKGVGCTQVAGFGIGVTFPFEGTPFIARPPVTDERSRSGFLLYGRSLIGLGLQHSLECVVYLCLQCFPFGEDVIPDLNQLT